MIILPPTHIGWKIYFTTLGPNPLPFMSNWFSLNMDLNASETYGPVVCKKLWKAAFHLPLSQHLFPACIPISFYLSSGHFNITMAQYLLYFSPHRNLLSRYHKHMLPCLSSPFSDSLLLWYNFYCCVSKLRLENSFLPHHLRLWLPFTMLWHHCCVGHVW